MEFAWCGNCHADVSLAHAMAELPCPDCGSRSYFFIADADDSQREKLLFESERLARLGCWSGAAVALCESRKRGLISVADFNLSSATLEWRRQCATTAADLVANGHLLLDSFRTMLVAEYDERVVEWLLNEYCGIRVISEDGTYIVEEC